MIKRLFLLIICFIVQFTLAQSYSADHIQLIVKPSDNLKSADAILISKKISQYLSQQSKVSATPYTLNVEVIPTKKHLTEAGLKRIFISNSSLILSIKIPGENAYFDQFSKTITGAGDTEELALTNVISRIKQNDPDIIAFIDKAKHSIFDYYENNCNTILESADKLRAQGKIKEAYGKLTYVLDISKCSKTAKAKRTELYKKKQATICNTLIRKANLEIAKNNYNNAIDFLSLIDEASPCIQEANKIIASMENKIKEQQKLELLLKSEKFRKAQEIEKLKALLNIEVETL